jgi:hypothetical protein
VSTDFLTYFSLPLCQYSSNFSLSCAT